MRYLFYKEKESCLRQAKQVFGVLSSCFSKSTMDSTASMIAVGKINKSNVQQSCNTVENHSCRFLLNGHEYLYYQLLFFM